MEQRQALTSLANDCDAFIGKFGQKEDCPDELASYLEEAKLVESEQE